MSLRQNMVQLRGEDPTGENMGNPPCHLSGTIMGNWKAHATEPHVLIWLPLVVEVVLNLVIVLVVVVESKLEVSSRGRFTSSKFA